MTPSCFLPFRGRAGVGAFPAPCASWALCAPHAPIPTFPQRGKEEFR